MVERHLKNTTDKTEAALLTATAILESNPHIILLFNSSFKMVDCNPAALAFLGFESKAEMHDGFLERLTKSIPEFQPDGRASVPLSERFKTTVKEGSVRFETELVLNDESRNLDVEFKKIPYESGFAIVAYVFDITESKRLIAEMKQTQENLRLARDVAEEASKAKSSFLASMSHEIRTPMNSIIGFSELAQDDNTPVKAKQYLNNISESATWLLAIINDILDISKIEAGKMVLESIPFDMHDVFEHCQSLIIPRAREKGIELYCYAEPFIGKKLVGDPVRMRQILMNLLANAVKFTNAGTVKLMATVINSGENNITLKFEVKDSGIGMSAEQIARIFEPFLQADDSITRRFGGTGLGLTITKNCIELMGGTLNVESAVGVGSKFSFELTFGLVDDDIESCPAAIILKDSEMPNFKGDVLVCEDNSLNVQVICDHLSKVGLDTTVAYNGKEGVDFVEKRMRSKRKPFDLIFMDIHMPVMDGLEAASKITELGSKAPIIALTANVMANDVAHYSNSGMSDTMGKPFTSQELWKCLMKHIPVDSFIAIDKQQLSEEEEKLQKQLRLNFVKDNQTTYADIIGGIEAGDYKTAHRLAHTLKGNAGHIGEKKLQVAAAAVESMLSEGKAVALKREKDAEALSDLEAELNIVLEKYAPLLEEANEKSKIKTTDEAKVREIIEILEPLLRNKNPDCEDLLDDIRTIPGAEMLAQYIEKFKFKQALEELITIKKGWEA